MNQCKYCATVIERGGGHLWYSKASGSHCFANPDGGHEPAAPEAGNDQEVSSQKVLTYADIKALIAGHHRCGWNIGPVKNPNPECGCMCGTVYNEKWEAIIGHLPRHSGVSCKCVPNRQPPEPHPVSAESEKQEKRPEIQSEEDGKLWLTERWVAGAIVDGNPESGDSDSIEDAKHCMSEACWKSLVGNVAALRAENASLEKELAKSLGIEQEDGEYFIPADPEPIIAGASIVEACRRFKKFQDDCANRDEHKIIGLEKELAGLRESHEELRKWIEAEVNGQLTIVEGRYKCRFCLREADDLLEEFPHGRNCSLFAGEAALANAAKLAELKEGK